MVQFNIDGCIILKGEILFYNVLKSFSYLCVIFISLLFELGNIVDENFAYNSREKTLFFLVCNIFSFLFWYRFMRTLKGFVRNRARPEGCIAEGYIAKECLNFCSLYLRGVETKFNREERNDERAPSQLEAGFSIFSNRSRPLGAAKYEVLTRADFDKICWYILNNCDEIEAYRGYVSY